MNIQSTQQLENTLLLAMPSMQETWFGQSLILVCEHSAQATMGIVLNKPTGMQLGELFDQMDIPCDDMTLRATPIHKGGPVQTERGFIVHSAYKTSSENELKSESRPHAKINSKPHQIGLDLFLSTSKDVLVDLAQGQGPDEFFIALGYAGWKPHQLVNEIMHNAWLNAPMCADLVYRVPCHHRWEQAGRTLGINVHHLCSTVGHA